MTEIKKEGNLVTLLLAVVCIAVIAVAVVALKSPTIIDRTVTNDVVGAMPGNEITGNEFTIGGVKHYAYSMGWLNATTSPCSFQTPNATTTMIMAAGGPTTATTTEIYSQWGNATTKYATTTVLATKTFSAGESKFNIASSTYYANVSEFEPLSYVNLKIATNGQDPTVTGRCSLELRKL